MRALLSFAQSGCAEVMLAQAGIPRFTAHALDPRLRGDDLVSEAAEEIHRDCTHWNPACAGMTSGEPVSELNNLGANRARAEVQNRASLWIARGLLLVAARLGL